MDNIYLSIVMPCYNEEKRIYSNSLKTLKALQDITSIELICVNDGSVDNTEMELERAKKADSRIKIVSYKKNEGKGNALKKGVSYAKGGVIAFLDADLELSPRLLLNYLDIMEREEADVVIGSKMHRDSQINYPFHRKILSVGYYLMLKVLFRLNVKDTQTGIKIFKAELLKKVMPKILVKRWAYDIEVLAICKNRGAKIVDAPVVLDFSRGKGRIKLKDITGMFVDTLAIFYRLYILKYYDRE